MVFPSYYNERWLLYGLLVIFPCLIRYVDSIITLRYIIVVNTDFLFHSFGTWHGPLIKWSGPMSIRGCPSASQKHEDPVCSYTSWWLCEICSDKQVNFVRLLQWNILWCGPWKLSWWCLFDFPLGTWKWLYVDSSTTSVIGLVYCVRRGEPFVDSFLIIECQNQSIYFTICWSLLLANGNSIKNSVAFRNYQPKNKSLQLNCL